jgi:predicted acylesterase/phospholipase RssA
MLEMRSSNAVPPRPRVVARIPEAPAAPRAIGLALPGGGPHGAFAWGVIDRLLEEPGLAVERIAATGTGALNAAVLAYGLAVGGPAGGQRALRGFWRRIAHLAQGSALRPALVDRLADRRPGVRPASFAFGLVDRLLSPAEVKALHHDPLRAALAQSIDFAVIAGPGCPVRLRLVAASLRTGEIRYFDNPALSPAAVLAAATVPNLFQAVEIGGEPWCSPGDRPELLLDALRGPAPAGEILVVQSETAPSLAERPGLATLAAFGLEDQLAAAGCAEACWDSLLELHAIGRDQAELWLSANAARRRRRTPFTRAAG